MYKNHQISLLSILLLIGVQLVSWRSILAVSDKRLCADSECKTMISMGLTKLTYNAPADNMVSFKANTQVRIYSKEAGSDNSVWGIEVQGRRGYAPKHLIKETKILVRREDVKYEVLTGLAVKTEEKKVAIPTDSEQTKPTLLPSEALSATEASTTVPLMDAAKDAPSLQTNSTETPEPVVNSAVVDEVTKLSRASNNMENVKVEGKPKIEVEAEILVDVQKTSPKQVEGKKEEEKSNIEAKEEIKVEKPKVELKLEQVSEEKEPTKKEVSIEKPNENVRKEKEEDFQKNTTLSLNAVNKNATEEANILETTSTPGIKDSDLLEADVGAIIDKTNALEPPAAKETLENITNEKKSTDNKEENKLDIAQEFTVTPAEIPKKETSEKIQEENKQNAMKENLVSPIVPNSEIKIESKENETLDISQKFTEAPAEIPKKETSEKIQEENKQNAMKENLVSPIVPNSEIKIESKENETLDISQKFTEAPAEIPKKETSEKIQEENKQNAMKENLVSPIVPHSEMKIENKEIETLDISQKFTEAPAKIPKKETSEKIQEGNNQDIPKDILIEKTTEMKKENMQTITKEHLLDTPLKDVEEETRPAQETSIETSKPVEDMSRANSTATLPTLEESVKVQEKYQEQPKADILNEVPPQLPYQSNDQGNFFKNEIITGTVAIKEEIINDKSSLLKSNVEKKLVMDLPEESENLVKVKPQVVQPVEMLPMVDNLPQYAESIKETLMDFTQDFNPSESFRKLQEEQLRQQRLEQQRSEEEKEKTQKNEQQEPLPVVEKELNSRVENYAENVGSAPSVPFEQNEQDLLLESNSMSAEVQAEEISSEPVVALPSRTSSSPTPASPTVQFEESDLKEQGGLFATILGTVNSFWSSDKKDSTQNDDELQRILYAEPEEELSHLINQPLETQFCEKQLVNSECQCNKLEKFSLEEWLDLAAAKVLQMAELLACLLITAMTLLVFLFGYYCFCNSSRDGALVAKLNYLERSLLAKQKENIILKDDLAQIRHKLSSIEDNSFGSNDMIIALKLEMEQVQEQNEQLKQQVHTLEKELENAAEAGLELNKIVSDLLSNQTGDESIISSVEELQRQLNEQQNVILEINTNLAEKSRENSELQLMLAEQGARLNGEIASLQQDNDELEAEKANLQTRFEEMKNEFDEDITKALEGKNFEIKLIQNEMIDLKNKCEIEHTKWQTSLAKVEALEECLKSLKKDPSVNINEVINVANVRAEVLDMQKKCSNMKERLDVELDGKRLAENKLKMASEEVEKLKQNFHKSEKDKLEAQTRLEVLSNYFKDKETQLQKELSLKEAMWLKQQGETTSTVDRLTAMQEEINSLKSQNESLRAEVEAQVAAHKAQIGTLENRAHETWLAARQSERRCEEARAEASALRRRLTTLVGGDGKLNNNNNNNNELNDAASPIHMESAGSPLLGRIPPPGFLPPLPFLGPPPPFMGMPPPPFVPPGEMRPAPLGRIMSPPPQPGSNRHGMRAAYTPPGHRAQQQQHDFDDEYDDDDDYEDEEDEQNRHRSRYSRGSDSWLRDRDDYSPSPRTYRSHSPADSRYNYTTDRDIISTYDTETDFSPPSSPRDRERRRGSRSGSYKAYSPQPPTASSPINENHSGKKYTSNQSSANKGTGTGTDSERSSKKTHNGRQHRKSNV